VELLTRRPAPRGVGLQQADGADSAGSRHAVALPDLDGIFETSQPAAASLTRVS
jgi:hypothetical protein